MKNLKKIEDYLQIFGLKDFEIAAYLGLLKSGPTTVLNLSKSIGINRSTTHIATQGLIDKGLVAETRLGDKRLVLAESPNRIKLILDQEKTAIQYKEGLYAELVSSLKDIVTNAKNNTSTEVRLYKDKKSIQRLYDEILEYELIRSYVNSTRNYKVFPENEAKFLNAVKSGKELWDIEEYNPKAIEINPEWIIYNNYHVKFFPEQIHIDSMDYLIYGDSIAIIVQEKDNSLSAVVINNSIINKNAVAMFNLMWNMLV